MSHYYLDAHNQPAGPATLDEIRALARDGRIAADPMVCPVGNKEWELLSAATGASMPASPGAPTISTISAKPRVAFSSTMLGGFVADFVKIIARWLSPSLLEAALRVARDVGHWAVLAGTLLALAFTIRMSIRSDSLTMILTGLVFIVALAVAQFAALRFLDSADELIAHTQSRVSSLAFLECSGLLAVLLAVGLIVLGIVSAIQLGQAAALIPGVLGFVLWISIAAIALHPETVSVESGQGSAGEEAIGLVAFFLKAGLKVVPLFFALFAVIGSLVLAVSIFAPNSQFAYRLIDTLSFIPMVERDSAGFTGASAVLAGCLLPIAAYFAYLVASLPLEIWRAVLSLPGKLDALRR